MRLYDSNAAFEAPKGTNLGSVIDHSRAVGFGLEYWIDCMMGGPDPDYEQVDAARRYPRASALHDAVAKYGPDLERAVAEVCRPAEEMLDILRKDGTEAQDATRADERSAVVAYLVAEADRLYDSSRAPIARGNYDMARELRAEASRLRVVAMAIGEGRHRGGV